MIDERSTVIKRQGKAAEEEFISKQDKRIAAKARALRDLMPKSRGFSSGKRHTGEGVRDFKRRRTESNRRRRAVEKRWARVVKG